MKYDLIVAGAGPSGCNAALAAARNGSKVLLIDMNGYPGGMNTAAMVGPIMAFHSGTTQVVKGIAQEIIDRLATKHGTLGHLDDPLGVASSITPIEPEILRLVYFEMLSEQPNITLLLHSFIYGVETQNNQITSVQIVNKSGSSTLQATHFIDATGDGDIAALAHVPFDIGRPSDNFTQPMTLMFKVGGVNLLQVIEYIRNNPEQFVFSASVDLEKYLAVSGFFDIVKKAKKNNDFTIPRDRVLFFQGLHPGEIFVNTTRVIKLDAISGKNLSQAEITSYAQVNELMHFFAKYLPGFENCYLLAIADTIGVRESRRFRCMATLTIEAVYNELPSEQSIAVCAFPIDIHDPAGAELQWVRRRQFSCYDIPYGTMVPKKFKNLLITGRCISATHEALASARISSTAMALGQAAGTAAALCVQHNYDFHTLPVLQLQQYLRAQGAVASKSELGSNNE